MAKQHQSPDHPINQIFDDLEKYLDFCVEYGYPYDEADLYNARSYAFRQFGKAMTGRFGKNQWEEQAKALSSGR
jgi:hypothetical protein